MAFIQWFLEMFEVLFCLSLYFADNVFVAISSQIPVNKVRTYGDLRNVLMKRIFLSALHFRINTRYQVH